MASAEVISVEMGFGKKLRRLMREHNDSQARLAAAIGVSQNLVSHWCRGENEPSLAKARLVALRYKVTLEFLGNDELDVPEDSEFSREDFALVTLAHWLVRNCNLTMADVLDLLAAPVQAAPKHARRNGGRGAGPAPPRE